MLGSKILPMKKLINFFTSRSEILAVYLFGSHATGKAGPLSDIDLAFLIDFSLIDEKNFPYGYQAFLITELMKLLGTNDVDVVILNTAPPLLKYQVLKEGEVIFCRSKPKRLEFYIKAFNQYQDIRPMLAVQNMYLARRLKENLGGGGG